jgi:diguanylate cyclase (GGDEF)-like protein
MTMSLITALTYWVIVAIWMMVLGTVGVFYLRNPRAFGTTRLLLAVVAIDTFRNIIENTYFGAYFGGIYGLLPPSFATALSPPILLILPKLLNVIAGCMVLLILLLRWLPATVRERSDTERTADDLRELASHDGLTGLYNRRHFLVLGQTEWDRARRYRRPLSLLMIDIDHFKSVNDLHGHDVGDRILIEVAQICRDLVRGADIVARLGGEEFAALLPETRLDDAGILAERLRRAVSEMSLEHGAGVLRVGISIGVSEASPTTDIPALLKQADQALYEAKRAGRDRVCLFTPQDIEPTGAVA